MLNESLFYTDVSRGLELSMAENDDRHGVAGARKPQPRGRRSSLAAAVLCPNRMG